MKANTGKPTRATETAAASEPKEPRINVRVERDFKKRIANAAKSFGMDEADFVRLGLETFLPQAEKGKIQLKAKA